jgi:hypothetical protein
MGLKPDDENHNEIARKRNDEDIRFAKTMLKKYGVKS